MTCYSRCAKHGTLFKTGTKCPQCRAQYDRVKRSKPNAKFYNSRDWKLKRQEIVNYYSGIDVWVLGRDNKIIPCSNLTVHHIQELSDYPALALKNDNLVPVSQMNHEIIHKMYNNGERDQAVAILRRGIERWQRLRGDL